MPSGPNRGDGVYRMTPRHLENTWWGSSLTASSFPGIISDCVIDFVTPLCIVCMHQLCDRNFGVGGDGVIFALPGKDGTDYTMRIYNSDGKGSLTSSPRSLGAAASCLPCIMLPVYIPLPLLS